MSDNGKKPSNLKRGSPCGFLSRKLSDVEIEDLAHRLRIAAKDVQYRTEWPEEHGVEYFDESNGWTPQSIEELIRERRNDWNNLCDGEKNYWRAIAKDMTVVVYGYLAGYRPLLSADDNSSAGESKQ